MSYAPPWVTGAKTLGAPPWSTRALGIAGVIGVLRPALAIIGMFIQALMAVIAMCS